MLSTEKPIYAALLTASVKCILILKALYNFSPIPLKLSADFIILWTLMVMGWSVLMSGPYKAFKPLYDG